MKETFHKGKQITEQIELCVIFVQSGIMYVSLNRTVYTIRNLNKRTLIRNGSKHHNMMGSLGKREDRDNLY